MLLANGEGLVSEELGIVLLCRKMRWGFDTYLKQPEWFLEIFRIVENFDSEFEKKQALAAERRNRRSRNG